MEDFKIHQQENICTVTICTLQYLADILSLPMSINRLTACSKQDIASATTQNINSRRKISQIHSGLTLGFYLKNKVYKVADEEKFNTYCFIIRAEIWNATNLYCLSSCNNDQHQHKNQPLHVCYPTIKNQKKIK